MHDSLIPERAVALDAGLPPPPYPIIDFHMHAGPPAVARSYVGCAQAYGVERAVGLMHDVHPRELLDTFGDFFIPCDWGEVPDPAAGPDWTGREIARIEEMHACGVRSMKYKDTPKRRCRQQASHFLADDRLLPVMHRMAELGIVVQAHIAEPSCWWPERFDPREVGDKHSYFDQVEALLTAVPDLLYVGCHFGGYPEDLDYLGSMMDRFPGFHIDTSATKWVIRELCRQGARTREFFVERADRILFGSDLVTMFALGEKTYYTSRLHVQRSMLELAGRQPSMIRDPDATGPDFPDGPALYGLDLPDDVLRRVCRGNALRLLGVEG